MVYSISTSLFADRDLDRALGVISDSGFSAVELWGDAPHMDARDAAFDLAHLKGLLRTHGLAAYSLHAPIAKHNLGSLDPDERGYAVEGYALLLEPAAEIGVEVIITHPNLSVPDITPEGAIKTHHWTINSLAALAEGALRADVRFAVENLPRRGTLRPDGGMADLRVLIDDFPPEAVGLCLDTGHALMNGLDPADEARIADDRLVAIHMQDTDGEDDRHWVPGEGVIDWETFRAALAQISYRGTWTFETLARETPPEGVLQATWRVAEAWGPLID